MKKLVSIVLALAMVLLCVGAAVADGNSNSITIHNTNSHISINGKTYTAYKLFDSTHSGEAYAYTLSTSSPFYNANLLLADGAEGAPTTGMFKTLRQYFTFTAVSGDTTKVNVAAKGTLNARAFADAMESYLANITTSGYVFTSAAASSETATITVNGTGYYLVTGNADAKDDATDELVSAVILTNENPSTSINPKADAPQLNKKITGEHVLDNAGKAATAQVGSTVSFELDSNVPDLTGYSDYTYEISDTMSSGLSFTGTDTEDVINGLVVKINNETLVLNGTGENANKAYTIDHDVGTKSFKVTIPFATLSHYAKGNSIVVTYSATVNQSALTTDYENNTATLKYSHSPYDNTTNETPESKVYVIDVNIDVLKVDDTDSTIKLKDAEFVLFKGTTQPADTAESWYHWNDTAKKVEWVAKANADVFKTVENTGNLDHQFQGLEAESTGTTYGLLETKAPTGYNLLPNPIYVTITATKNDSSITLSSSNTATLNKTTINIAAAASNQPVDTATIGNNKGTVLPSTGGIGTTIFYVLGGLLVVGAAVILVARRKASN